MPRLYTYVTWLTPIVMMALVSVALVRQKLWTQFPVFLSFLIFKVITAAFLVYAYNQTYATYFWSYWTVEAFEVSIKFLVFYEIFVFALKPYPSLSRLTRLLFGCVLASLLILAVVLATTGPTPDKNHIMQSIFTLEWIGSLVQVGWVAFLFLFVKLFAIPWRHYLFGITLGFALNSTIELLSLTARRWFPFSLNIMNISLRTASALLALVWVAYFVLPKKEPVPVETNAVSPLREWNEALRQILAGSGVLR